MKKWVHAAVLGAREVATGRHGLKQNLNAFKHRTAPRATVVDHDPVTLSIVSTGRCNLACEMCPTHSRKVPDSYEHLQAPTGDMTLETFKEITSRFPNTTTVNFIGAGEPLMIEDLYDIIEYAVHERNMVIKPFTNGILLGDHAERLARSSADGINVSVNSHDPDDFERLTGMSAKLHGKIVDNVRKLREAVDRFHSPFKIKVSFILDQQNYRHAGEMLALAATFRPQRVFLANYLANPYEGMSAEERSLWDDRDVVDFFQSLHVPMALKGVVEMPHLLRRKPKGRQCTCHWDQIRVNGDGEVGCCSTMLLDSYIGGDFRDPDIFNNEVFRERRARFLSDTAELESPCYHCPDNIGRPFPYRDGEEEDQG